MEILSQIPDAKRHGEQLRLLVDGKSIDASLRNRAALSCLAIAQEHHHAVLNLLECRLFASAVALVRVCFEAYVRGEWASICASDSKVEKILAGGAFPDLGPMISDLEKNESFNSGVLSNIKSQSWNAMCDFTHTGGLHLQRWQQETEIGADYSNDELEEALQFVEAIASMSVIAVGRIANDTELMETALNLLKEPWK